jgi:hypothetical protein
MCSFNNSGIKRSEKRLLAAQPILYKQTVICARTICAMLQDLQNSGLQSPLLDAWSPEGASLNCTKRSPRASTDRYLIKVA